MPVESSRRLQIDPEAIARAEEALAAMAVNFEEWLRVEIVRMQDAFQAIRGQGQNDATMEALYHRAHDLKGLGSTYGYPIISQIAGTLCRLIDTVEKRRAAPLDLVEVHVESIKAAARNKITSDEDATGRALVKALESKVRTFDPEG
ncbi:MAG: Hpt domain-containing protein [Phenylobacterium sp.]|jgi:chemotaxis protein histidine kinase CheA|nr:Hpt domain-containing protein [Phenylobacterium sp.]